MAKLSIRNLCAYYDGLSALHDVSLDINDREILGVIGPANSGKSSLLRALNRLIEFDGGRVTGEIRLDDQDILTLPINELRRRVGLIFASPVVLPGTIYKNLTYGPKLHRRYHQRALDELVYYALTAANLWDEVKDRLYDSAANLSGGQQQRLCIARTLALKPEVIMMDEPCSGLDPISTAKVESAMLSLKDRYTFMLVTNNTKQAARVSTRVAFFLAGGVVELD
jgi:phosphate transport system ATP-binding protein